MSCFLLTVAPCSTLTAEDLDENNPAAAIAETGALGAVHVILQERCASCHAGSKRKGGFSIENRKSILAGGESGPAVTVGNSAESLLIELVTEADPDSRMPAKGDPLTPEQVGVLRAWIDGGLAWAPDIRFRETLNESENRPGLALHPPTLATSSFPAPNPIDLILADYFKQQELPVPGPVPDRDFIRRAFLDLTGLLPTPDRIEEFETDPRATKRNLLIRELLADRIAYSDHWLTFWNDMLRNAYRGTGFIDNGRRQITRWLYGALYENKPYDEFVYDLISPAQGAESDGFSRGIIWRGVVNASQRKEMQAAQNISQVFMATNLKCASCHDSFVNDWKLKDAYGLASVFAESPLEINRCNKPTGENSDVHFIYPELGKIDPGVPMEERRQQLADLVTRPENGRLSRAIVNRLWAWFFGRGLIEPEDNLDKPAWHPGLLEFLAADFQDHGYDLKHLMHRITTSLAYQMPGVPLREKPADAFVFRGSVVKRMTAEQFVDAVSQLTGSWPEPTRDMVNRDGRNQGGQLIDILQASAPSRLPGVPRQLPGQWIWSEPRGANGVPEQTAHFRSESIVKSRFTKAHAVVACDDSFTLFVNGKEAARGDRRNEPSAVDLTPFLQSGTNVFTVVAVNKVSDKERRAQEETRSKARAKAAEDAKARAKAIADAAVAPAIPAEFAEFHEFTEFKRLRDAGVFESIDEFREFKQFEAYRELREQRAIAEFKAFQNFKADQQPEPEPEPEPTSQAGFFLFAIAHDRDRPVWTLGSHGGWKVHRDPPADEWTQPGFDDASWPASAAFADPPNAMRNLNDDLYRALLLRASERGGFRAALAMSDSLLRALGRPNRDQVVTRRDSIPTMLQALELANGDVLTDKLKTGAEHWLSRFDPLDRKSSDLVDEIFPVALGRPATETERTAALDILGPTANSETIQDLLWTIAMLPEFQLLNLPHEDRTYADAQANP